MPEDVPFSEEQIAKLNELAKLPPEQQRAELQKFIKTLNKEQVEFLKKQQGAGTQCIFCSIAEGKIESKMIYEDPSVIAVLDINPANKGHVIVFPRRHVQVLGQLSDEEVMHLFKVVNKASVVIFENIKAEGTNIFLANGAIAGQNMPHVIVHVIPRFQGDEVVFEWKGKKMSEKDLDDVKNLLSDKIKFEQKIEKKEVKEIKDDKASRTYRIP
ncbi:MAG: HIT family protein [Nanoarchaeota archaeon]